MFKCVISPSGSSGSPYLPNPLCSILENVTIASKLFVLFSKNKK